MLKDEVYYNLIEKHGSSEEKARQEIERRKSDPLYAIRRVTQNASRAAKSYSGQNMKGNTSVQKPITYTDIVEQVRSTGQTAARTAQNMIQNPTPVQAVRNVFNSARKGAAMTQAAQDTKKMAQKATDILTSPYQELESLIKENDAAYERDRKQASDSVSQWVDAEYKKLLQQYEGQIPSSVWDEFQREVIRRNTEAQKDAERGQLTQKKGRQVVYGYSSLDDIDATEEAKERMQRALPFNMRLEELRNEVIPEAEKAISDLKNELADMEDEARWGLQETETGQSSEIEHKRQEIREQEEALEKNRKEYEYLNDRIGKLYRMTGREEFEKLLYGGENALQGIAGGLEDAWRYYAATVNRLGGAALDAMGNLAGQENLGQGLNDAAEQNLSQNYTREWSEAADRRVAASPQMQETKQNVVNLARMLPSMAAGTIAPGIGNALMGVGAAGGAAQDAYQESGKLDASLLYGGFSGMTEMITEKMFDGIPGLDGGEVADVFSKKLARSPRAQNALRFLMDATGEGVEEVVSEFVTPYIKRATYDPDAETATLDDLVDAGIGGMVNSVILQGAFGAANRGADMLERLESGRTGNSGYNFPSIYDTPQQTRVQLNEQGFPENVPVNEAAIQQQAATEQMNATIPAGEVAQTPQSSAMDIPRRIFDEANPEPVKAGRTTTIYNPYTKGPVPENTRKSAETARQAVTVMPEAYQETIDIVSQARQTEGQSFKGALRKKLTDVFKRTHKAQPIEVQGVTFNGEPYFVEIGNKAVGKIVSDPNLSAEKISLLQNIDQVVSNGEYVGSGSYSKNKPGKIGNTIRYDYFETPVTVNGQEYIAAFDVEVLDEKKERHNFRTYKLNKIDLIPQTGSGEVGPEPTAYIPTDVSLVGPAPTAPAGKESSLFTNNIPRNGEIFNQNSKNNLMDDNRGESRVRLNDRGFPESYSAYDETVALQRQQREMQQADVARPETETENSGIQIVPGTKILSYEEAAPWESKKGKIRMEARKLREALFSDQIEGEHLSQVQKRANPTGLTQEETYQLVRNAPTIADGIVTRGLSTLDGDVIGESLDSLFSRMPGGLDEDMQMYLLHRRNANTEPRGDKILNATREESLEYIKQAEKKHPTYRAAAQELYDWYDTFMQNWAVKSGRVNADTYQMLRDMDPDYVPVMRKTHSQDAKGRKAAAAADDNTLASAGIIKRLEGSTTDVIDLRDAIAFKVKSIVRSSLLNESYKNLYNAAASGNSEVYDYAMLADNDNRTHIDNDLENGFDGLDAMKSKNLQEIRNGKYAVIPFIDGEPRVVYVNEGIYNGLNKLANPKEYSAVTRAAGRITGLQKKLITQINPYFALRNVSRDAQNYLDYSEENWRPALKSYAKSTWENVFRSIREKDSDWQHFLALGGRNSGFLNNENSYLDTKNAGVIKKTLGGIEKVLSAPGEWTEILPRFAEYKNAVKKYGDTPEGRKKAILAAADVTVNFSRGGSTSKLIGQYVPYFNAAMQGLDKIAREAKRNPGKFARRSVTRGVITSALLNLLLGNNENEHYKDLNDRMKNTYFLIPNPFDKDEKGQAKTFFKVRKSEAGNVFGAFVESAIRYFAGEETGEEAFGNWFRDAVTNLAPGNPLEDNLAAPFLEIQRNEDFAGRKIVPSDLEDAPAKYQYDSHTSDLAIALGDFLGLSPKQVDHVIKSYTGELGENTLGLVTEATRPKDGGDWAKQVLLNPLKNSYVADPRYSSNAVDKLYNQIDKAEEEVNGLPYSGGYNGEGYNEEYVTPAHKRVSEYRKIQKEIAKLRAEEQDVYADTSLSANEKQEKAYAIREEINEIAKGANTRVEAAVAEYEKVYVPEISMLSDSKQEKLRRLHDATGADYKDLKEIDRRIGNMTSDDSGKAQEKKAEYIDSLGGDNLDAYYEEYVIGDDSYKYTAAKSYGLGARDYYRITKATSDKWPNGDTVEGSKIAKQIEILMESDVPSGKKYDVFKTIISPDTEKAKTIFAMTETAGIGNEEYLKAYAEAKQITGTKDSKGKTIAGSHDKNLLNYLNKNSDLSVEQRKALYLMFATTKGGYNGTLQGFVNGLDVSAEQKKAYYEALKK